MTAKRRARSSSSKQRSAHPGRSKGGAQRQRQDLRVKWALTAVVVVGAVAGVLLLLQQRQPTQPNATDAQSPSMGNVTDVTDASYRFIERRPTLSPNLFSGSAAFAYQIAQEIPQVLDQLYCYCYCKENHGHKTLLTCYVDSHAAT